VRRGGSRPTTCATTTHASASSIAAGYLPCSTDVATKHGLTLAQLAIAWTVAQKGITHALVGARDPDQAIENAQAGSVGMPQDEQLDSIDPVPTSPQQDRKDGELTAASR
jgi:aryl-alcohol dehydrogenase-like predicted oxidoreductase